MGAAAGNPREHWCTEADTPPDSVQTKSGGREQDGCRNTCRSQNHTFHSRWDGAPQSEEGTGRHDFHTHEKFGYTQNLKVIHAHRDKRLFRNEDPEDILRKENQNQGTHNTPQKCDGSCGAISFFHAIHVSGAVILSDKGIYCNGKTFCSHPGNGFDLTVHLLDSDGSIAPSCDQPCNDHGNHGKDHALQRHGNADSDDGPDMFPGRSAGQGYFVKHHRILFYGNGKDTGNNHLSQNRGKCGTCDAHFRKRFDSEYQDRIQKEVKSQSYTGGKKRRLAVSHCGDNAGHNHVDEVEHNQSAGDHQINSGVADHLRAVQMEKGNQRSIQQKGQNAVQDTGNNPHLQCASCVSGGFGLILSAQRMRHFDLPSDSRQSSDSAGQPHVHSGSSYSGHCVASHASDSDHVDHIVGHLNQRGSDDRERQTGQRRKNRSVQ